MRYKPLTATLLLSLAACGGTTSELTGPVVGDDAGGAHDTGGTHDSSAGHDSGGGTSCGAAGSPTACQPTTVGLVTAMAGITSIADDDTNVYVADEGGQIQAIAVATGASTVLGNLGEVNADLSLAVGAIDVYFSSTNTVGFVPKTGGAFQDLVSTTSASGIAAVGSTVFWAEPYMAGVTGGPSGEILSLPAAGGTPTVLVSKVQIDFGLTTDGVNVYWVAGDGDIDAVPVGGGPVKTLATKQYGATTLAADGVNLYWTSDNAQTGTCGVCPPPPPPTATDSSVYKLPLTGGTPTVLATGYAINTLAVDGTDAYWFDSYKTTLSAVSVAGGTPTVLAEGVNSEDNLLADTASLFWISADGKLMRLEKNP
jgi:hypothetical protein